MLFISLHGGTYLAHLHTPMHSLSYSEDDGFFTTFLVGITTAFVWPCARHPKPVPISQILFPQGRYCLLVLSSCLAVQAQPLRTSGMPSQPVGSGEGEFLGEAALGTQMGHRCSGARSDPRTSVHPIVFSWTCIKAWLHQGMAITG